MSNSMLEVKNIYKSFGENQVLKGVNFSVDKGDVIAVLGSSGSGKTTLLKCISFLEPANKGEITFDDFHKDITKVTKKEIRQLRMKMGFVFQSFNLFRNMTALENVEEGLIRARKVPAVEAEKIAFEMLDKVGMTERAYHYPDLLSGGQQQRVAIARALASKPDIVLADEPTGNLDTKTSDNVIGLLHATSQKFRQTILMITHNPDIAQLADQTIRIEDGRIVN